MVQVSAETVHQLNLLVAPAKFVVTPDKDFMVEFPNQETCANWCNKMNWYVFENQQGRVFLVRGGEQASQLGTTFRFPEELDHFARYVGAGIIFFNPQGQKWEYRNFGKTVGHFEVGYGTEPFQTWMERQLERLVVGKMMDATLVESQGA